jgi:predicted RNA-binding Zn-ribbon protein involved in translation (DUF1610 family)
MVDATCLNEDCEKDTWRLTKHPDDYANGVTCPKCGTTRVDYDAPARDGERKQPRGEQTSREERQPRQERQPRAPARADRQPREAAPARREGGGLSTAEGLIATIDGDAPAEVKKQGIESVGKGIVSLFKSAIDYNTKKKEMAEERATQADIQQTQDKPACECGFVFTEIGANQDRIKCPECGTEYEVYVE